MNDLTRPPRPMAVWATLVLADGTVFAMAGTAADLEAMITAEAGHLLAIAETHIAGPN